MRLFSFCVFFYFSMFYLESATYTKQPKKLRTFNDVPPTGLKVYFVNIVNHENLASELNR